MRFTDGFWQVKPEFTPEFTRDLTDWRIGEKEVRFYMPYREVKGRADTVNLGGMTGFVSAPMENVLKIRLVNHIGTRRRAPELEVFEEELPLTVCEIPAAGQTAIPAADQEVISTAGSRDSSAAGSGLVISSGKLALKLTKKDPVLTFLADGKKLTGTASKVTSMMHHRDGRNFLVTGLNLKPGEQVYGLGERFTPMIKNGQTVDLWNEDGGTSSELAYKNISFYMTSGGYGVFVNHSGPVSFEVASEKVETVQFSIEGEQIEYYLIYGPTPKEILTRYTALTGRAPVPPEWSFGLWLSTSFTTDYDEKTVMHFIDEMQRRQIPLSVFHFDCCWMKPTEWCNFTWDDTVFPDPEGMLSRIHEKGVKVCVWINSYIAQNSPLFDEAAAAGYLLKKTNGDVWQWDMWQGGMGLVDFTNPDACAWYESKLEALLDMGVDCFKTDFGERIPTEDIAWHDASDPMKMHNYYTFLYNRCVYGLLKRKRGAEDAVVFARSAVAGGQRFPVHWGGDSTSTYISMAETLRGGLSLADSGFAYWSHDIGGFEDNGAPDLYKRWVAFGLLSSHSRLHGSTSYRVPWNYDEEACEVLRMFTELKGKLRPYLMALAHEAAEYGWPLMRPMHLEFPEDETCAFLDRQYMLGDALLVAPVFREDGFCSTYLPEGRWQHVFSGRVIEGGRWHRDTYGYLDMPLFIREGAVHEEMVKALIGSFSI